MDFTARWGYNSLTVINLFAYRTPYPQKLKEAQDPVGRYNARHTQQALSHADLIIACWGRHGNLLEQNKRIGAKFNGQLFCLATNADGSPAHPLYQRASTQPRLWDCSKLLP